MRIFIVLRHRRGRLADLLPGLFDMVMLGVGLANRHAQSQLIIQPRVRKEHPPGSIDRIENPLIGSLATVMSETDQA